jgi:coenzyme F420 hydrogenase subunit beta
MTGIATYLLEIGRISGVVATRTMYTTWGPRSETFIAGNADELLEAQGSKYCPTPALAVLKQVEESKGRFAYIGTPCQIAGLRMLQARRPILKDKILITCGGFRDLRETDTLIRRAGIMPCDVITFRYRGGGQPGSMLIESRGGKRILLPYPDYARRTGFIKHKRCRLCVDATGELADISCGDAWLDRFIKQSDHQWSLAIVRSDRARDVVAELITSGRIKRETVTVEELKRSQAGNLTSKKMRYDAKERLYRLLGSKTPHFDGGFRRTKGGIVRELRVFVQQHLFHCSELMGLYPIAARLLRRY